MKKNSVACFSVFLHILTICYLITRVDPIPQGFSSMEYCAACQLIAKHTDRLIKLSTSSKIETKIMHSLDHICNKKMFLDAERSSDIIVKACYYIIEHYRRDIEKVLFRYHNKKGKNKSTSYLHAVQHVCSDIGACRDRSKFERRKEAEEEGYIYFAEEIDQMKIVHGPRVKVAGGRRVERNPEMTIGIPRPFEAFRDEL